MIEYSIIIATHLRADLLQRAIKSCMEQTLMNQQVIVISDVDDPATYKICCELLRNEDVFIQRSGPVGPSASRNLGIQMAAGKYVVFLDDDDAFESFFLENVSKFQVASESNTILYTDCTVVDVGNPAKSGVVSLGNQHPSRLWTKNFIPNNCVIYPRSCIDTIRFDVGLAYEDWDFLLSVARHHALRHIPISGPIIYKNSRADEPPRGAQNENKLLECYLKVYKKHSPLSSEVAAERIQLFHTIGVNLAEAMESTENL